MGIFDFISKQFIDVIDWVESEDGILAYRYPMQDREIQNGAKLTVRDSQLALVVDEGKVADQFTPGLHTITTQTLPVLTNLRNWDKAFDSPFKTDVYFFSTRDQLDQKWGTPTAVTIRDAAFGAIRVQAFGAFSYKIVDPKTFYLKVSGTREVYRTSDLASQLRSTVAGTFGSIFGKGDISFVDMAAQQVVLAEALRTALVPTFSGYGLALEGFQVQSVTLPEELQKRLDERAGMAIVGDLARYTQFQAAQSISVAAANQGGGAGAGIGLGAGIALGQTMAQALNQGEATNTSSSGKSSEDVLATIERLHNLMQKGAITEAEFNAKKQELLLKA
jgi:membrane protease subunit (stomatin/prohibitin family)